MITQSRHQPRWRCERAGHKRGRPRGMCSEHTLWNPFPEVAFIRVRLCYCLLISLIPFLTEMRKKNSYNVPDPMNLFEIYLWGFTAVRVLLTRTTERMMTVSFAVHSHADIHKENPLHCAVLLITHGHVSDIYAQALLLPEQIVAWWAVLCWSTENRATRIDSYSVQNKGTVYSGLPGGGTTAPSSHTGGGETIIAS